MHAPVLTADEIQNQRPNLARFGMLTFLVSEAMLFAGLICGYIVLRSGAGPGWHLPEALRNPHTMLMTVGATALLLSSSFTLHFAESRLLKRQKGGLALLLLTVVLGGLFLANQANEWAHLHHEGFWFDRHGIVGSSFFALTGFHGMHVLIGVLLLVVTLIRGLFGLITPERHGFMECTGLYWHFVDIVWVFLFLILYIL